MRLISCKTSKLGFFEKTFNILNPITIFAKSAILDVWQCPKDTSENVALSLTISIRVSFLSPPQMNLRMTVGILSGCSLESMSKNCQREAKDFIHNFLWDQNHELELFWLFFFWLATTNLKDFWKIFYSYYLILASFRNVLVSENLILVSLSSTFKRSNIYDFSTFSFCGHFCQQGIHLLKKLRFFFHLKK